MIFQKDKTPFQAIKTISSKSRKIDIFPKGLAHRFGLKFAVLNRLIFQVILATKMCVSIFQNVKTPFQAIKTRSSRSPKIDIFPKGIVHGFGPKLAIFPPFFVQAIQAGKMCFLIFCHFDRLIMKRIERKNAFLGYKSKKLKKSKN